MEKQTFNMQKPNFEAKIKDYRTGKSRKFISETYNLSSYMYREFDTQMKKRGIDRIKNASKITTFISNIENYLNDNKINLPTDIKQEVDNNKTDENVKQTESKQEVEIVKPKKIIKKQDIELSKQEFKSRVECRHILVAGKNKGETCNKKIDNKYNPKLTTYCRVHSEQITENMKKH
jgi:hypothetical protein